MYKDREMIVRGSKWQKNGLEITSINEIVALLPLDSRQRIDVLGQLAAFSQRLEVLPETMRNAGVDEEIIEDCKPVIEQQCDRMQAIEVSGFEGPHG
jgi:hypothetical protein